MAQASNTSDLLNGRKPLICNCEKTMQIDMDKLSEQLGLDGVPTLHTHLCRAQVGSYEKALEGGEPLLLACTQEAPLFSEIAEEKGAKPPAYVNIRERAGWSDAKGGALAKIAALLAEGAIEVTPTGLKTIHSSGICLVYGAGQAALDVAEQLSSRLSVSLILTDSSDVVPPSNARVPIYRGRIVRASGALGGFEIVVDDYAPLIPSSRAGLEFVMARDGANSKCDLIFDMSGGSPLFAAKDLRDGYFHVDPDHPAGLAKAMFEITDQVGEFEKPLYVKYNPEICVHSRNGQVGCHNCLDVCPASAITPDGDGVLIDNAICGGCGNCSAVCPTGAASYAYPGRADFIKRAQTLLSVYLAASGKSPVLLVHDESHGSGLISAMARFGRGLPAHVLPLSVYSVSQLGHDFFASAILAGARSIVVLASPSSDERLDALNTQINLINIFLNGMGLGEEVKVTILSEQDPDVLQDALDAIPASGTSAGHVISASGDKRETARLALIKLNQTAPDQQEILALPEGAPYGLVHIASENCTLCLACVSTCPTAALSDNPEMPQVRFTELSCVQCGLCRTVCPESVITLEPRYNFTPSAMDMEVLHGEEPFDCVRCGKPFGSRSSIEKVVETLKGKHWMFQSDDQIKLIEMCDDCRILAVAETGADPLAMGEPPRIRTTDDYLAAEGKTPKKTGEG